MSLEFTHKYYIDTIPFAPSSRAIALGMFDGLHEGHMDVIRDTVRFAAANNLSSCVQTFVNLPKCGDGLITTVEEQCDILSKAGVDEMIILDYNEVCNLTPEEFVYDYLKVRLGADTCISGEDYRFGKGASGDTEELKRIGSEFILEVRTVPPRIMNGRKISSTWLKEALKAGHPDEFAAMCGGRRFRYTGRVVHGKGMGNKMGFPTANLEIPSDKVVARRGVYATRVKLGRDVYYGVTNIGLRPTLEDAVKDICETHILDFDEDIYGAEICVELCEFLRDEQKFSSADELIAAVDDNKKKARELFGI